jgi:hypothetical protein
MTKEQRLEMLNGRLESIKLRMEQTREALISVKEEFNTAKVSGDREMIPDIRTRLDLAYKARQQVKEDFYAVNAEKMIVEKMP